MVKKKTITEVPFRLNLGCGMDFKEGYVNCDMYPENLNTPFKKRILKVDLNDYPLPFEDNTIDEIICSHVLEHLVDPYRFISELHRILKKGGRIIVKVPSSCNQISHLRSKHFKNYMTGFDVKYAGGNGQEHGLFKVEVKGRLRRPFAKIRSLYLWFRNLFIDEWEFRMEKL